MKVTQEKSEVKCPYCSGNSVKKNIMATDGTHIFHCLKKQHDFSLKEALEIESRKINSVL